MKVHFSRTFPLTNDSAGYVSAVLQRYTEDKLIEDAEIVAPTYCFVIGIGSRTVHSFVKATAARLKAILLIHESHPAMSARYGMGWVRAAL